MTLINRADRVLPIKSVMMTSIRKRRVRRAAAILEELNIFPESRSQIVTDYACAIRFTYRGILQVVNLEAVLRYVEATGIEGAFVETGTYTGGPAYMGCGHYSDYGWTKRHEGTGDLILLKACLRQANMMAIMAVFGYTASLWQKPESVNQVP